MSEVELELSVNGEDRVLALGSPSVEELLGELGITQTRGVAVAVDDHVIPKSVWGSTRLKSGQRVEIIRATQGG